MSGETKKVRVRTYGHMVVHVNFEFEVEMEVPAGLEDHELLDYVHEQEEYDDAWEKDIQGIHNKLTQVGLEYEEEGGHDEIDIEEIED